VWDTASASIFGSVRGESDRPHSSSLLVVYDKVLIVDADDTVAFATYSPALLVGRGDVVTRWPEKVDNHLSSTSLQEAACNDAMRLLRRKPTDPEIGLTREQNDIVGAVRPRRAHRTRSHAERCAIEVRAVQAVKERLRRERWSVEDVGATRSYDLHCSAADGRRLFVEVKGTTGPLSTIVLTANEVELARRRHPETALFVVHDIELSGGAENPQASGGTLHEVRPWLPEESRLNPAAFSYRLDNQDEQPNPVTLTSRPGTSESVRTDLRWQSRRFS
jgi:Domain of unknown function (DUF3883)